MSYSVFRRRSGKAALIVVGVLAAAVFIAAGIWYANKPKEPPKFVETQVSPQLEADRQKAGEAHLGTGGNPGQPNAPVERMPDGKPVPM